MSVRLSVNGLDHEVDAHPDTPLLYVLRDDLGLNGAKFGCGMAQCGACTVLRDGTPLRACIARVGRLEGSAVTTIEGLAVSGVDHPVVLAFLQEQAAQCGYCTAGMVMTAVALLAREPRPTEAQVREAMNANLCRCGTYNRIVRAVLRAAGAPRA